MDTIKATTLINLHNRIKKSISKTNGLFYQYRACNISEDTIYDIENIMHDVVYARSPLYMNDPFDSSIGFSSEKIYDECIELCLEKANVQGDLRSIISIILKNKLLGALSDFVQALNQLKKKCNILLPENIGQQQKNRLFKQIEAAVKTLPSNLRKRIDRKNLNIIVAIILSVSKIEIEEEDLLALVKADDLLHDLEDRIIDIKENLYQEQFRQFLSSINITCFSQSGWDNPLMWAHYANSYSGMCVEYDFSKIDGLLFFSVEYNKPRPILSLSDIGINKETFPEISPMTDDTIIKLIEYLCVKNKQWDYEKEWRIIDPQGSFYTSSFINLPYIKSITFGVNVNPIVKSWIIDICKIKGIECYKLKLGYDTFSIEREQIDVDSYCRNIDDDEKFIDDLCKKIVKSQEKLEELTPMIESALKNNFDVSILCDGLKQITDIYCYYYFARKSYNLYQSLLDWSEEDKKEFVENLDQLKNINDLLSELASLKENSKYLLLGNLITWNQKKELDLRIDRLLSIVEYYNSLA